MIVTYMLHRDPNVYKSPDKYIPDRFLSENCVGRHPYSYVSTIERNYISRFIFMAFFALVYWSRSRSAPAHVTVR
jgi:Cytochrome P450